MDSLPNDPISAEEFLEIRPDLPEAGQWAELHAGQVKVFDAPDSDHHLVASHLTRILASLAQSGTPVFRPVLNVSSNAVSSVASTVQIPAVAYFDTPARFDLVDAELIDTPPGWVIEIASTGDRRRVISERVAAYVQWGVLLVWIVDPRERTLTTLHEGRQLQHTEAATVSAAPVAPLEFTLSDLFVEPDWWTGAKR